MLYRAEDTVGKFAGTSRIGYAESNDGVVFVKKDKPVLFPQDDHMYIYEQEGGCEDPRVVSYKKENGTIAYLMLYTAFDGNLARLCVATSDDLLNWKKHGLAFGKSRNGKYKDYWSKSGAVITSKQGDDFVATKINGKYWMYWGESCIYLAYSDDLINWEPFTYNDKVGSANRDYHGEEESIMPIFSTRENMFDSYLVEPGPQAIITEEGILLIYNSANSEKTGDSNLAKRNYAASQILFSLNDPSAVVARNNDYFITPDKPYEITGQVGNVCFVEGLVKYKNKWLLYYGTADSKIAVATLENNII